MISRVEKRDIVVTILLSVVTCGIYGIVWFIMLTDDCSRASGDNSMKGATSLLLTIVTCGIYYFYWSYQMGKRIAMAQEKRNLPVSDNSVLYLVLSLLSLGFVTNILIQADLNRLAEFDQPKNA